MSEKGRKQVRESYQPGNVGSMSGPTPSIREMRITEDAMMNEDKKCKDCKYAFRIAIAPNDIWCDLDKLDYWAEKMACNSFEERGEEEEE